MEFGVLQTLNPKSKSLHHTSNPKPRNLTLNYRHIYIYPKLIIYPKLLTRNLKTLNVYHKSDTLNHIYIIYSKLTPLTYNF